MMFLAASYTSLSCHSTIGRVEACNKLKFYMLEAYLQRMAVLDGKTANSVKKSDVERLEHHISLVESIMEIHTLPFCYCDE